MFLSSLMAIAAVLIMGVISPGPSFIFVARNAVARSRLHGMVTALGTGAGAAIFSIMAMLGLQKVLTAVPELFIGLKVAGGLYLLWLGYKIFRGSAQPMDFSASGMAGNRSLLKTFRDGLYTQLSNPKTALVFASIFTALLPAQIPTAFYYIVPLMSFDRRQLVFAGGAGAVCRPPAPRLPAAEAADRHRHRDGAGGAGPAAYRHLPHPLAGYTV